MTFYKRLTRRSISYHWKKPTAGYNTRALLRRVDQLLNKDLAYDLLTNVEYKGSGIESDPFIVDWTLRDPVNPLDFTSIRKWGFTFIS